MKVCSPLLLALVLIGVLSSCNSERKPDAGPRPIEILFLGHSSEHHNSSRYLPTLSAALSRDGIRFTYTENPTDLNPGNLALYDGLMIYANHEKMDPEQEKALLDFVAEGKGFLPIHAASFCFQNSEEYIRLVGGQFQKHDTGTFVAEIVDSTHPVMQSVDTFSTWDETYVHHKLSNDRKVLMERVEGSHREPWTWIREHGKGRVFYTAYGHDERSWSNPGFQRLIRQGILWAVGDEVRGKWEEYYKQLPELKYRPEPNIPNYERRNPPPQYQEPLTPEESAKLIQVPPGFRLELFASEPDIINPIAMEWDERGRLWVIETVDYPNTVRDDEGVGDDRIKICEDTDGDGRADKFTIFADKLNIPTSMVFANGGVIISQAPVFLFLKDTNGDDKADTREILVEGWGTFDTHAGPSNLQYGFDNHIWGVVGYSGFKGNIAGKQRQFGQGIYRMARDLSSFDFMTRTSNNTWGLGFNESNDVFASTANNTHSVYMGIPDPVAEGIEGIPLGSAKIDGHYAMHPVTDKVRQVDVFGGFTAASGHHFYRARNFPEKFWNRAAFVAEPTGHLVHIAWIEKDGAGFVEKDGWNLFASADEWVAPVEAKPGPDGAVWVLDWYNFIVQHNPTPTRDRGGYDAVNGPGNAYENPLRDKTRGRIWRVVHQDASEARYPKLNRDNIRGLVEALSNDNIFWRMTAQRLIVESGNQEILPRLFRIVRATDSNSPAAPHALWCIDGLGAIKPGSEAIEVVSDALKHSDPAVRKAAIQILSAVRWTETEVMNSGILDDPDPNTRLTAFLSLTRMSPSRQVGEKLYEISKEENVRNDNWLAKAVYIAAAIHRDGFIQALHVDQPDFDPSAVSVKRELSDHPDGEWKIMALPQTIERGGLQIDGIIWFRKTVELPASVVGKAARLSLGPVDDSDETYVNGTKVGGMRNQYSRDRIYTIPPGVLKGGRNVIAVRVEDTGGQGGINGKPEAMFLEANQRKIRIDGNWKYEVEREYRGDRSDEALFADVSIAELFAAHYMDKSRSADGETTVQDGDAIQIIIRSRVNEMKYDRKNFSVEAGKKVRIIFENPDHMQHNLVITARGSLSIVGKAADKLATSPNGAERQYVPDVPEVLFATSLVDPQKSAVLEFVAPTEPGDYPFVCTFPGHWSIMNGVMTVVSPLSAKKTE